MDSAGSLRERRNGCWGSHSDELEELQKRGQDLYRQKQYEPALACFTQVIGRDANAPITVLDNRAATHTKLGNLRAALNDSHKMMRQNKHNCIGYLRGGKVLQLMSKFELARDLYEMGVGKVPSSDPNCVDLRRLYNKMVKHCAPKSLDPLEALPLELVEMAFQKLRFHDICHCLRVSKSWLQLLESMPSLWTDLDFIVAKRPVTLGAIRKYIKRGKGLAARVTLPKVGTSDEGIPRYITTRCKELQELIVPAGVVGSTILYAAPCALNLKILIVRAQCQVTVDCVDELLAYCRGLEQATFENITVVGRHPALWEFDLPKLRSLTMIAGKTERDHTRREHVSILRLTRLVKRIPNIVNLTLTNWSMPRLGVYPMDAPDFSTLSKLETLALPNFQATGPPRLPMSLRALDVSGSLCPSLESTTEQLKQLVRLRMPMFDHRWDLVYLERLLEANKGGLTHLDLTNCPLRQNQFKELIESGYLKSVEELRLDMCDVNDDIAITLGKHAPAITTLHLQGTKLTGVGVKGLVISLQGTLNYLGVDRCEHVSKDAVDWANSMRVRTSHMMLDQFQKGRKVRWV